MIEKEIIGKEVVQYEALDNLIRQDGWKILMSKLEQIKSLIMEALILEKDYNKIITLQERYRAFNSVLLTVNSAKSIKEKLYDDMRSIIEDEKLKEEFDI